MMLLWHQLWDWDSMFTGVALLNYGSTEYFAGSMLNFLAGLCAHSPPPSLLQYYHRLHAHCLFSHANTQNLVVELSWLLGG